MPTDTTTPKPAAAKKAAAAGAAADAPRARNTAANPTPARPTAANAKAAPVAPGLFTVTESAGSLGRALAYVPLDKLELACNPRTTMDPDSLARLARLLMRDGQFMPAIGRKGRGGKVLVYAGQRRLRAAQLSGELAGSDGYEGLKPVTKLIVLLLDYEPTAADIRRVQAQENNAREALGYDDQLRQFEDCWADRVGADEDARVALVAEDLGISPGKAWNLRRAMTLPQEIRARVADRPSGDGLSIRMASRLAAMQTISPQLAAHVAARITTPELHGRALENMAAFVQATVVEDPDVYAVRIDMGSVLDAHAEIERARPHLSDDDKAALSAVLQRSAANAAADDADVAKPARTRSVEEELDALAKRMKRGQMTLHVDAAMRERASNGQFAWVQSNGQDFADAVYVVDPTFLIECAAAITGPSTPVQPDGGYFSAGAPIDDAELDAARKDAAAARSAARKRSAEATDRNSGLGMDINAGLLDPTVDQMDALRAMIVHLLAGLYPDVIAYGAGWTDRAQQQPVGDSTRFEPRDAIAITAAEVQRALDDPNPLRGIAMIAARWCAAFVLDPDGVTIGKPLGSQRMNGVLRHALPADAHALRSALWLFMRPMLSPGLVDVHRDAFVADGRDGTVDLAAHRGDSTLDGLDLGDDGSDPADA